MSLINNTLFERAITPSEKLYIVGDSINHSFSLQLVLEMDSEVDESSLNQAIMEANQANPYANLSANLRFVNPIWHNSANIQTNLVQVVQIEWDGHDIQSVSFFHSHKFDPNYSVTQVTYLKGCRHFLVFRAFHGVMDGMGLYHWVSDIFRAWNKQPLIGSQKAINDYDFLKHKRKAEYRPNFAFDCTAPMRHTASAHTHYIWHKVTLPGKINAITAKICQILLASSVDLGAEKARFMIPVDLRNHVPDLNTTANFANPIFVEAKKGANWQLIYSNIVKQLAQQNELKIGMYDAYLRHLPLPLLKGLLKTLIYYQNKKNQYMVSGLVSKLAINLSELKLKHGCKAIDGFFLPINVPLSPIVVIITEHDNATTICFSLSNAHATSEDCINLTNQCKKLVEKSDTLVVDNKTPYCDTLWPIYNDTFVAYPQEKNIFSRIWDTLTKQNHQHALLSENSQNVTYEQLRKRTLEIASYFSELGVKSDDKVAIFLPRNTDIICSMLACWYLGAAYIPIDIKSPIAWVLTLLNDAKPALVVHDHHVELSQHYSGLVTKIPEQIVISKQPKMKVNSLTQLAYIIYTSGSTGTPKGVMINHSQLNNYLSWAVDAYRNNDQPYYTALFTSIAFDLTITTIYLPLLTGGSITLIPNPIISSAINKLFNNQKLNFLKLTPSHLRMVNGVSTRANTQITLVVGGEALPCKLAKSIVDKVPGVKIFNEYGPTETTVGCMIHQYDVKKDIQGSVPIGLPAANTRIYCLNSECQPVKIGQEGEIYIAGSNVGVGYLNKIDATNKSFLSDPFSPGERMYRSGDLAKHREDGLLIYLGRQDQQTKIRGHRIELSEIENAILAIERILHVVVMPTKLDNVLDEEVDVLAAYVVSQSELQIADLRRKLSLTLPNYMIPQYFIFLSELPMTINGKVDQKKLPKPISVSISTKIDESEDLLTRIRQLFSRALSLPLELIDNHATFDEMGGDSIQMAFMINEILIKIISPNYHAAFDDQLQQLLTFATPYNFYELLSKMVLGATEKLC